MSLKTVILLPVLFLWMTSISETSFERMSLESYPSKFSLLSKQEQAEAIEAFRNGDCIYKDIQLYGKVEFVESFPDFTIEYVDAFPDLRVQFVSSFPNSCGKWQKVTSFPDFTVQVVTSFPDLKVRQVDSFPGMD